MLSPYPLMRVFLTRLSQSWMLGARPSWLCLFQSLLPGAWPLWLCLSQSWLLGAGPSRRCLPQSLLLGAWPLLLCLSQSWLLGARLLDLPLPVCGAGLWAPASLSLYRWGLGFVALPLPIFDAGGWAFRCSRCSLLGVVSRVLWKTPLTPTRYFTRVAKKTLPCEQGWFLFVDVGNQ